MKDGGNNIVLVGCRGYDFGLAQTKYRENNRNQHTDYLCHLAFYTWIAGHQEGNT